MATIQTRTTFSGTVRYRAQVRSGGRFISKTFSKRADAKAWARKFEGQLEAGIASPLRAAQQHTVAELIDNYAASAAMPVKSAATAKIRLQWWKARIGSLPLSRLTKTRIREELDSKEAEGCTNATVNRQLAALRRVLNYGVRNLEWLAVNPATGIENRPESSGRKRVIEDGEFNRLLAAARELAAKASSRTAAWYLPEFLIIAYATGMRRGELQSLKWADVHPDRVVLQDTKNGDSRSVPLNADAVAALAAIPRTESPYVFAGTRGTYVTPNGAQKAAREHAGIGPDARGEHLVIHTLRHAFATEIAASGANAFQVMAATGHRTMQTAARYVHGQHEMAVAAHSKRVART